MDSIIVFITEYPITVGLLLGLCCLPTSQYFLKKYRGIKHAEWIVNEGQYLKLPDEVLEEAINDAKQKGTEKQFMLLLRMIRQRHGHKNIKNGHLYWIWDVIEGSDEISDDIKIPTFTKEEG